MPIYEYHCGDCGKRFELIEGFHDEIARVCRYCSGTARRIVSRSSFILKGSGWYLTDYARKSTKQDSARSEGSPQGTGSKETPASSKDDGSKGDLSKDTP